MWHNCFTISITSIIVAALAALALKCGNKRKGIITPFNVMLFGVFIAVYFVFFPVHKAGGEQSVFGTARAIILSLLNSVGVFTFGTEYEVIAGGMDKCPESFNGVFQVLSSLLYMVAPAFTVGFVLSLFKNFSSNIKYFCAYRKDVYIFTELNEKSVTLAADIKKNHKDCAIVFTDVFESNNEFSFELAERAKALGSICFKKDVLAVNFKFHSSNSEMYFFAIGSGETENLNQSVKLIEAYKNRSKTNLYVFSTKLDSELLLAITDKGLVKVRRANEVMSLINRLLFEKGEMLFDTPFVGDDGVKEISAVVVGMGKHGTEMVKALSWFCQMDGYRVSIDAFDASEDAEDRFKALAPELMSDVYNGKIIEGEAQYKIAVHSGVKVDTASFAEAIMAIRKATYVLVSLGDDDLNIITAINLRMLFERIGIHPVIQAIVTNGNQTRILSGIKNYRGQPYDIEFIGNIDSSYTEDVIIDSELEQFALKRHLKWGSEEEFWNYEYNYRSSIASAIHMKARISCGIKGADKKEEELTEDERDTIEILEHKRWNAYMRAQGYIYSGSKDEKSRNDLAKMHHNLVDYASLDEKTKRKDSKVGTE